MRSSRAAGGEGSNVCGDLSQRNGLFTFPCAEEWCERFRKMKWVYLVEGEGIVREGVQEESV